MYYDFFLLAAKHLIISILFQIRSTVYYKFGLRYKPLLINITKNACDILKNDYKPGVVDKILLESAKKYSNVVHQCPFQVF